MKGFSLDKQDQLFKEYTEDELSMLEDCQEFSWSPWEFLSELKARNLHLNVELDNWLDAADLKG